MRATIYQPQYFPRLHYFNRILSSDTFVILDSSQYTKSLVHVGNGRERHKSYQSDTPIKLSSGLHLLTIPVKHEGLLPISKTRIDYMRRWVPQHLATLRTAYGKTTHFDRYFPELKSIYAQDFRTLSDLNIRTICWALSRLIGFELDVLECTIEKVNHLLAPQTRVRLKRMLTDQDTGVLRPEGLGKGTEWTAAILKILGATEYLHGGTAQAGYMEHRVYEQAGVNPILQDWHCREYPQQFTEKIGFLPNLSILDLLFNAEPETARDILYS